MKNKNNMKNFLSMYFIQKICIFISYNIKEIIMNEKHIEKLYVRSMKRIESKDYANAEDDLLKLLNLTNQNDSIYSRLYELYCLQEKFDKAMETIMEGIVKNPNSTILLNTLAIYYQSKEDFTKSEALYIKAIGNAQDNKEILPTLFGNYATLLMEHSKYRDAVDCLLHSFILDNSPSERHWNLSLCYLNEDRITDGLQYYKYRFYKQSIDKVNFLKLPIPYLENIFDSKDKNVLILNEQGYGDEILFSTYIRTIKRLAKFVKIQCYPESLEFFKENFKFDNVEFFAERSLSFEFIKDFDAYSYTGTMWSSNLLNSTLMIRMPASQDFYTNKKIGICWKANSASPNTLKRSLTDEQAVEIIKALPDKEIISLQSKSELPGYLPYVEYSNINETANIIKGLRQVITIDSLVAHLAGYMGIPTILLINKHFDWRWKFNTTRNNLTKSTFYESINIVEYSKFIENPSFYIV